MKSSLATISGEGDKASLRVELRARRVALPATLRRAAAGGAARRALRLPALRRARHVAAYLACGSELSTAPLLGLLFKRGIGVYVPKLRGPLLRFIRISPKTPLRRNVHGIREPVRGVCRSPKKFDLVLLPLLGFDAAGNRLGTGSGYYDRAFAFARVFRRPLVAGYGYAVQRAESLPREPWDVRLDAVITEKGVLRWPTG